MASCSTDKPAERFFSSFSLIRFTTGTSSLEKSVTERTKETISINTFFLSPVSVFSLSKRASNFWLSILCMLMQLTRYCSKRYEMISSVDCSARYLTNSLSGSRSVSEIVLFDRAGSVVNISCSPFFCHYNGNKICFPAFFAYSIAY